MGNVKQVDTKKISVTRREFYSALKKASQKKPKTSQSEPKQS